MELLITWLIIHRPISGARSAAITMYHVSITVGSCQ